LYKYEQTIDFGNDFLLSLAKSQDGNFPQWANKDPRPKERGISE
jgi:hypothetical protein